MLMRNYAISKTASGKKKKPPDATKAEWRQTCFANYLTRKL